MEGGNTNTSCLMMMGYGDHENNNNGNGNATLCSPQMMMMMPPPPPPSLTNNNNNNAETSNNNNNILFLPFMDTNNNNPQEDNNSSSSSSIKSKIMAHPHYPRLLAAYLSCQKIGAPPEVVARLEEICATSATMGRNSSSGGIIGEDPALDQFMEAYCEMLTKYEQELSKPFKEAMVFLSRIECQFKALTLAPNSSHESVLANLTQLLRTSRQKRNFLENHSLALGEAMDRNGSSDEEVDVNNSLIDPQAEDRELKGQLLRKYSGYLGSLKQEFMKKRKKGKLPKEARQQLVDWWLRHIKWPYPSESQKLALAESTGLDQKQINNWFINQRKRHWKPSEDMQFVVMDAAHPHYYMDNVLANHFPMDMTPSLL